MLGLVSFASCASWQRVIPDESRKVISDKNYEILNGDYKAINNSGRSLADALLDTTHKLDSNAVMGLQCIDKNRIKITLREGDKILSERVIKGKIKDNYFTARQSCKITFWFILNGLGCTKTRIGLLNSNALTVDTKTSGIGFLIIVPGFASGGEVNGIEYERLK